MKIFGLTGNWFKAPVVIVKAKSFEEAVEIIRKEGSQVLSPWNVATARTLWETEVAKVEDGSKPRIIATYMPNEETSRKLLELFRNS